MIEHLLAHSSHDVLMCCCSNDHTIVVIVTITNVIIVQLTVNVSVRVPSQGYEQ